MAKQKHELEKKYLPTTEEEARFAPYRERLCAAIGEHLLDASEFEDLKTLGSGTFGIVRLAKWSLRGFARTTRM